MSTLLMQGLFFYISPPLWRSDVPMKDICRRQTKILSLTSKSVLALFDGRQVQKVWRTNDPRTRDGLPCCELCNPPHWKSFPSRWGPKHLIPNEPPLDSSPIATKEEQVRIIYQLRGFVDWLHEKELFPETSNLQTSSAALMVNSASAIQVCGLKQTEYTMHYSSPWRVRNADKPLRKAEDLRATGIPMWKYTLELRFSRKRRTRMTWRILFMRVLNQTSPT